MGKEFDLEDPKLRQFHKQRLSACEMDKLLGICEFALLDGYIDQDEAESIYAWLNLHRSILDTWPASVLYNRLQDMLADGVLDPDEQGELLGLVMQISPPRGESEPLLSSSLPLTQPAPAIRFSKRSFCFTGVFDFGSRAECHTVTRELGGEPIAHVTKSLDYLVIGSICSELWKHSSFGLKISKAIEYQRAGDSICIISEQQWAARLKDGDRIRRTRRVAPVEYFRYWNFEISKELWPALGVTLREFVDKEKTKLARQRALAAGDDKDCVKRIRSKYRAYTVSIKPRLDFHEGDIFKSKTSPYWVQVVAIDRNGYIEAHHLLPLAEHGGRLTHPRSAYLAPPDELAAWLQTGEIPLSRRIGMGQSKNELLRYLVLDPGTPSAG